MSLTKILNSGIAIINIPAEIGGGTLAPGDSVIVPYDIQDVGAIMSTNGIVHYGMIPVDENNNNGVSVTDVALYISADGSDSNSGTALRPFKTFTKAWSTLKQFWNGNAEIHLMPGQNNTQAVYALDPTIYLAGLPVGLNATRLKISSELIMAKNPETNVVMGNITITNAVDVVTLEASAGLTNASDGAFRGFTLFDQTQGNYWTISDNTTVGGTTTFKLQVGWPFFGPNTGDVFSIHLPGAILQLPNGGGTTFSSPNGIEFSNIEFAGSSSALHLTGGEFHLLSTRHFNHDIDGGSQVITGGANFFTEAMYISNCNISNLKLFNPFFLISDGGSISITDSSVFFGVNVNSKETQYRFDSKTEIGFVVGYIHNSPSWGIEANNGTNLSVYGPLEISNSASDGIFVGAGSYARIADISGTGNDGYGLNLQAGSAVDIDLTGNLTSLTGVVDDVLLGATVKDYGSIRPTGYVEPNTGNRVGIYTEVN